VLEQSNVDEELAGNSDISDKLTTGKHPLSSICYRTRTFINVFTKSATIFSSSATDVPSQISYSEVKFTLYPAMKAQRGSRDITLLFLYYCHRLATQLQLTDISHHLRRQIGVAI